MSILDTVEPDLMQAGYDDPRFYSNKTVESLIASLTKEHEQRMGECRKLVLLEAADKLDAAFGGNAGIMFRGMAEGGE